MPDSLDVDLKRHHVGGGDKLMFQGYEYYNNGSAYGSAQPGKELAAFSFSALLPDCDE